jgi:hypothetical protein
MVRRRKEIADQLDVALMLNFLWCYDNITSDTLGVVQS